MAILNQDKEILETGRKNKLKDADAPLRDQISRKLFDKLEELEIGQKVDELWRKGTSNRTEWATRQQAYLALVDEHVTADTSGPFAGSSQLHIPMPLIVLKTFHARMYAAVMSVDPPFHAKARNEASVSRVQTVADTLRYYLLDGCNYGKGLEEVVDRWIWEWAGYGTGVKKWRWDTRYTRFVDVQTVPEAGPAQIVVGPDGNEMAQPTVRMVEKEVPVTKKIFDGPVCENVDLEDFVVIGGGGDIDLADAIVHRQFLTASELWTYADRKIFDTDAVEEAIEGGPNPMQSALGNAIKHQQALNAGTSEVESERTVDRYEIAEAHLRVDVDGSGINSDVVVWVHLKSRRLLRATYLHRISPSGERPFVKAIFQHRKGQENGVGLLEMLYPLSKEMDAMHNMRIDFGMISVMPVGFYRASSSLDPTTIQMEPGALIPLDNPQTDIYFPNMGNRTTFGMQEEAAIQTMIERLTSISDINLGVISGQGATRTATGSRLINSEMSSNLDIYLKRLNRAWKRSLRLCLHNLQQRIPPGTSFRLNGDDGADYWTTIKAPDQLGKYEDFDIEVTPNSESSNQQIQMDKAQQIVQMTSNPLDIQLGIVGALERHEALKNLLQSMGVRDFGKYIVKVDPAMSAAKLTPEEEANRVLRGQQVQIIPQMDHQGFLDWFDHVMETDELLGQFNEEQTMALAKHAQMHGQMLQAIKAQEAQAANAAQMRANSANSAQQAPVGMPAAPGPAAATNTAPTPAA